MLVSKNVISSSKHTSTSPAGFSFLLMSNETSVFFCVVDHIIPSNLPVWNLQVHPQISADYKDILNNDINLKRLFLAIGIPKTDIV